MLPTSPQRLHRCRRRASEPRQCLEESLCRSRLLDPSHTLARKTGVQDFGVSRVDDVGDTLLVQLESHFLARPVLQDSVEDGKVRSVTCKPFNRTSTRRKWASDRVSGILQVPLQSNRDQRLVFEEQDLAAVGGGTGHRLTMHRRRTQLPYSIWQ